LNKNDSWDKVNFVKKMNYPVKYLI